MEIGNHIRTHRTEAGMSQDDLAARVYVSCQTISSWENDKTYPDVQSLLLLSEIFGVTVDSLIKEDVATMTKVIDSDVRTMKRLAYVMLAFTVLTIIAGGWFTFQVAVWDWPLEHALPTILIAVLLWGIAMFTAVWVDRIKKRHDLITYKEILAYWRGDPIDRDTARGRRERAIPSWMKVIRTVGWTLIAMALGAFFGFFVSSTIDKLFS